MSRQAPTLSPQKREVLIDALRAPAGYELDCAIGTTFSVDLTSALLVPMAFALFDTESGQIDRDPIAVLAATRGYADKVALYCEQGRIAAAARQPSVLAYLERTLHPVSPPAGGAFHPKVWILRFKPRSGAELVHRVLCLSRNLTFDRSWDTIVRLEQSEEDRPEQTGSLISFVNALNRMSTSPQATSLAGTLRGVSFDPPRGFARLEFAPYLGSRSRGSAADPLAEGGDSLLVISPFLGQGRLDRLSSDWSKVYLASRAESLDRLPPELLRKFSGVFEFDSPDADLGGIAALPTPDNERLAEATGLNGLHAKVNSAERDGTSYLLLGSANATGAAFERNVEFCVLLSARDRRVGPKRLLHGGKDPSELRTLLRDYEIRAEATAESAEEQELQRLEDLRRDIAEIQLAGEVITTGEEMFELRLSADRSMPELGKRDRLTCWPITFSPGEEVEVSGDVQRLASFKFSALGNATSLICFRLRSQGAGRPELAFTLLADLTGAIDGRLDAVMSDILSDRARLMRFLFLLLSAGGDQDMSGLLESALGDGQSQNGSGIGGIEDRLPLIETLLRTFARDRGRLEAFNDALRSLRRISKNDTDLPSGLLEIWKPFEVAMADGEKRRRV